MIKFILDFIKENYQFVIYITIFLVEFLIIIFKRPTKIDSKKERILKVLPLYIEYAERYFQRFPKSGLDKLNFVLNSVKKYLEISTVDYDSFIIESVEAILSTPSKKGEFDEE